MVAAPARRGRTAFAALGVALALASLVAMQQRLAGGAVDLHPTLARLLDFFLEPGLLLGWLVLGGPLASFPHDAVGRTLSVAANTGWWLLFVAAVRRLARRLRRAPPGDR